MNDRQVLSDRVRSGYSSTVSRICVCYPYASCWSDVTIRRASHAGAPHNPSTHIWVRSRFEVLFVTYMHRYIYFTHKSFFHVRSELHHATQTRADVLRLARPKTLVRAGSRTTTPRHASLAPASRGPLAARHVAGTHATRSRARLAPNARLLSHTNAWPAAAAA